MTVGESNRKGKSKTCLVRKALAAPIWCLALAVPGAAFSQTNMPPTTVHGVDYDIGDIATAFNGLYHFQIPHMQYPHVEYTYPDGTSQIAVQPDTPRTVMTVQPEVIVESDDSIALRAYLAAIPGELEAIRRKRLALLKERARTVSTITAEEEKFLVQSDRGGLLVDPESDLANEIEEQKEKYIVRRAKAAEWKSVRLRYGEWGHQSYVLAQKIADDARKELLNLLGNPNYNVDSHVDKILELRSELGDAERDIERYENQIGILESVLRNPPDTSRELVTIIVNAEIYGLYKTAFEIDDARASAQGVVSQKNIPDTIPLSRPRWWGGGFAALGEAGTGISNAEARVTGLTAGVDLPLQNGVTVGVGVAWASGSVRTGVANELSFDSVTVIGRGAVDLGETIWADGYLHYGVGWNRFEDLFGGIDTYQSDHRGLGVGVNKSFSINALWSAEGRLGWDGVWNHRPASIDSLGFPRAERDTYLSRASARLRLERALPNGTAFGEATLRYVFSDSGNYGLDAEPLDAVLGGGVDMGLDGDAMLSLRGYAVIGREDYREYGAALSYMKPF